MRNTTTEDTTSTLSVVFSIGGIPNRTVSDNGPQLNSEKFEQFYIKAGRLHITTKPFHLASNDLAERVVRTFKYFSTYRFMPNSEAKLPAKLMRGRPVRTV